MSLETSFAEEDDSENPYKFCDKKNSFGVYKGNGSYLPRSDFGLELLDFVKAESKTGYACSVFRKCDEEQRYVI